MSDDEDAPPPRPLTPPKVDSSVFMNAAFGNLGTLKKLIDGETAPTGEGEGEGEGEGKGDEAKVEPTPGGVDENGDPIDLNARDDYGNTALCWSARNGADSSVEYLIAKGANIESAGYGGMRPLHFASNFAREKVVKMLLSNGADVDAKDEGGNTALHWAAAKGVLTVVTLLVEAGAGLMAPNSSGATPLHKACNSGHISIVRKLIDAGANVVVGDGQGNTALHVAASSGFEPVVELLLERGAKNARNKAGKSCLEVATSESIKKLIDSA